MIHPLNTLHALKATLLARLATALAPYGHGLSAAIAHHDLDAQVALLRCEVKLLAEEVDDMAARVSEFDLKGATTMPPETPA